MKTTYDQLTEAQRVAFDILTMGPAKSAAGMVAVLGGRAVRNPDKSTAWASTRNRILADMSDEEFQTHIVDAAERRLAQKARLKKK